MLKYEMDCNAMIRGQEGRLPADRDPWAQIPLPPGTVATVYGEIVDRHDGYFEMFTQRFVDASFHGLEFPSPPKNLIKAAQVNFRRVDFESYWSGTALAGTRLRAGTTGEKFPDTFGLAPVSAVQDEISPRDSFEAFARSTLAGGGPYVFCLRQEPSGRMETWFGDIIAIVEPVAVFRTDTPNPVLWLTPENFISYREYGVEGEGDKVVSEITRNGPGYRWRVREKEGSLPLGAAPVERLLYALNTVEWSKESEPLPADATLYSRRIIEYREGDAIRLLAWTSYLNQYRGILPVHIGGRSRGLIEHPSLGRMEGEYPLLIWGILNALSEGTAK